MSASKVVLITGANTGIGYQVVRALCGSKHNYRIFVGGRSPDKVQDAIAAAKKEFPSTGSELLPAQIDLVDDASIEKTMEAIKAKFGKLDVLVNNAGAQLDQQWLSGKMTAREMWAKSWDVNVTGTEIVTSTAVPLLLKSDDPRILFVTSGTSTLEGHDNTNIPANRSPDKGWPKSGFRISAYRSAKTGLNMLMREWGRILKADGVKVWAISPGFLATGLGGSQEANQKMGAQDPASAGPFFRDVIEGGRDADAGKVILSNQVQPW